MDTVTKKPIPSLPDCVESMTLNLYPEKLQQALKQVGMGKFYEDAKPMVFSEAVVTDRILNFYEGATRAGFSPAETRIGIATAIIISCRGPHITREFEPFPCGLAMMSSFEQPSGLKDEHWAEVASLVRIFSGRNVTPKKLNNRSIGLYLLDAMRMWVLGSTATRMFHLEHANFNQDTRTYRRLKLESELSDGNLSVMSTQWGTIKSFNQKRHVGVASVLALFERM